jgi:multiple sugar transport system substrate-binding protein
MPKRLEISTLFHADKTNSLRTEIERFAKRKGIDLLHQEFDYTTGWSDFVRMSIYGTCPDVSEIGTTWINDFAKMNVLRPFSEAEVENIRAEAAFVPAVWESGAASGTVWAIPWFTNLRLFYYRRDLFDRAGVDEKTAFRTPAGFEQALLQLREAGIPAPWVVPTLRSYNNVHNLAMWIWQAGKDFVDEAGNRVLFDDPGVRSAILAYLRLHRFISKEMYHHSENEADLAFLEGKVAAIIGGPWIFTGNRTHEVSDNLGLAIPFGCAFVGGSSLIVWNKTDQAPEALDLVAHLAGRQFQSLIPKTIGLLPGSLDGLDDFPLPETSFAPLVLEALKTGRALPNLRVWGLIEDRLVNTLPQVWDDILASPKPDLEAIYDQHILPMADHINLLLFRN